MDTERGELNKSEKKTPKKEDDRGLDGTDKGHI